MDEDRPGFKLLKQMGWQPEANPYSLTDDGPVSPKATLKRESIFIIIEIF